MTMKRSIKAFLLGIAILASTSAVRAASLEEERKALDTAIEQADAEVQRAYWIDRAGGYRFSLHHQVSANRDRARARRDGLVNQRERLALAAHLDNQLTRCTGKMEGVETSVSVFGNLAALVENSLKAGAVLIQVQPQPAPSTPVGFLFQGVPMQASPGDDATFWLKAHWISDLSGDWDDLSHAMEFTLEVREASDGSVRGTLTKKGAGVDLSAQLPCSPLPH